MHALVELLKSLDNNDTLHALVDTLTVWLANSSGRSDFFNASGHEAAMKVVEEKHDMVMLESCAKLAAAACLCHEGNKCRLSNLEQMHCYHDVHFQQSLSY